MATTQVHLIDPCGGMILVLCEDGARVLFGNQVAIGTTNDVLQRLFEVLEDGAIDYFVHSGVDGEGSIGVEDISEFFPVKNCMELNGKGIAYPQTYTNFKAELPVEMLDPDDIMEFGETRIRLFAARTPRDLPEGALRPVVMRVTHGEADDAPSLLCCGMTNGVDWLEIMEMEENLAADCIVIDGRRPLDLIITTRPKGLVSADHLRKIAPRTVVLGADPGNAGELRLAARELYSYFARLTPGGEGLLEVKKSVWFSLALDATRLAVTQESRAIGKVA